MAVPLFSSRATLEPLMPRVEERVRDVLRSGRFVLGPEGEAFERELADFLGVGHCVGVGNGTDALTIALRALGVEPGDEVVVPAVTFYATAEAVVNAGATPVLADVDPETCCVTAETVGKGVNDRPPAVSPGALYG